MAQAITLRAFGAEAPTFHKVSTARVLTYSAYPKRESGLILKGTLVNIAAICIGGLLGLIFQRMPENIHRTVMAALALAAFVIGLSMTLKTHNFLILMGSLSVGGALGELVGIDAGLKHFGEVIEKRLTRGKGEKEKFTTAFMTTTLLFCLGPLNLLGSLDAGIRQDFHLLYTKAIIDGVSTLIFTATLSIGAMFAAIPLFIVQSGLVLISWGLKAQLPGGFVILMSEQVTSIGGAMIIAISFNLLGLTKIRAANLLPALPIAILIDSVMRLF